MANTFYPSKIINQLYDIMDAYAWGVDRYLYELVYALEDSFKKNWPDIQWKWARSEFPDEEGGVCAFCWVEDGHPQMIMFDYTYSGWEVL